MALDAQGKVGAVCLHGHFHLPCLQVGGGPGPAQLLGAGGQAAPQVGR